MSKCLTKGHRFQKFDDTSLFCERCGERRVIAVASWTPIWPAYPYYPNTWWPRYTDPYVVTSVSWDAGTSTTVQLGNAYPDGTTYSLNEGTVS